METKDYLQFNLTIKLGSLLSLPSKFIHRLRRIDDMLNHDLNSQSATLAMTTAAHGSIIHTSMPPPAPGSLPYGFVAMPGPLAFLTSGYAVGLVAMNLVLFVVILLQVSNLYPSATNVEWVQTIGHWAGQKGMADVCWSTFGSVCLALVVGALTRGLEGANASNTSPFNLFGYAMLGPPSRPDRNVLITLFLPLLQLTMIHSLGVKKRWARYRLVPTSICSLANLIHFNVALLTKPSSYPLLNYLPCLLETILVLVTLLTIGLNVLTQLLLEGEINRPLFGHARSLAPKWDEDFAIVLLRLGTASLEATNVAGLGNEVGPIAVGDSHEVEANVKGKTRTATVDGSVVELTSGGVLSISRTTPRKGSKRDNEGFANEVKTVKVKNNDDDWLIDHAWLRELMRFGHSLFAVVRGFCRLVLWGLWYKWKGQGLKRRSRSAENLVDVPTRFSEVTRAGPSGRGEDEDGYRPSHELDAIHSLANSSSNSAHASDDDDEPETEVEDFDGGGSMEAAGLYTDLLTASASSSVSHGPILLAHMTTASSAPLTRRGYNQLVADPGRRMSPSIGVEESKDDWSEFVQDRRVRTSTLPAKDQLSDMSEGRMNCVICTAEPREIICWPCRCLALCNDCRENLASRFSASKHSCPCCRRSVEGYSKIYIP
ncbi:hypothetical protein DFH11DRAFT_1687859 [Phellopilus nigrolimitatus]|nr:hypothetical protein DFH11DRAFT_1687859 [Phellopilus nigrolimitatus]